MNAKTAVAAAFAFAESALTACTVAPMVGDNPGYVPPKLFYDSNHVPQWDNPSAFGPVPANLAAKGAQTCGSLNTKDTQYKAIGYHPRAMNLNGKQFPNGGFYCVAK